MIVRLRRVAIANAADGFSLIEMLIASAILMGAVAGIAQLSASVTTTNVSSRNTTYAAALAAQKVEELRGLAWAVDASGATISDLSSDTAVSPETPAGGTGLSASAVTSLQDNTPGYVDYLDTSGNTLGGGAQSPRGTAYIRRWWIQPLPSNPDTLVFQVLVTNRMSGNRGGRTADARVVGVKTRKAQ